MLNSLWFLIEGQQISKISFSPIEAGTKLDIIQLATLLPDYQTQLGKDWLAISPKGYQQPIPENSVDWFDPDDAG